MLLRQSTNPRTVVRAAMASLLVFSALSWFAHPTTPFWDGAVDGVRGAAIGITIALAAVAGVLRRRNGGAR